MGNVGSVESTVGGSGCIGVGGVISGSKGGSVIGASVVVGGAVGGVANVVSSGGVGGWNERK